MGLFGKKKDKSTVSIIATYYSGDLQGFSQNDIVILTVNDEVLTFEKPPLKVTLDKTRILGMDRFDKEEEYMLKFHGDDSKISDPGILSAFGGKELEKKTYIVIRYTSKDGTPKQLDFYTQAFETIKLLKFKGKLMENKQLEDYSI